MLIESAFIPDFFQSGLFQKIDMNKKQTKQGDGNENIFHIETS